jgi:hypothetical protein
MPLIRFERVESGVAAHVENALAREIRRQALPDDCPGAERVVSGFPAAVLGLGHDPGSQVDPVEPGFETSDAVEDVLSFHGVSQVVEGRRLLVAIVHSFAPGVVSQLEFLAGAS